MESDNEVVEDGVQSNLSSTESAVETEAVKRSGRKLQYPEEKLPVSGKQRETQTLRKKNSHEMLKGCRKGKARKKKLILFFFVFFFFVTFGSLVCVVDY